MEHGHLVCKLTTLLHQQYLQLILQTQLAHSAGWELDIKQWGVGETNGYGTVWVVFPISFINTPVVVATHNGLDAVVAYVSSSERNAHQVAIVLHKIIDNSVNSAWGVSWIAIGI